MEYFNTVTLIKRITTKDDIAQEIETEQRTTVPCKENIVGTKEFYNAVAVGIKPTAELQIRTCNYDGQDEVEYKNKRYALIRSFTKDKFDMVLVIGVKQGVKS